MDTSKIRSFHLLNITLHEPGSDSDWRSARLIESYSLGNKSETYFCFTTGVTLFNLNQIGRIFNIVIVQEK